MNIAGFEKVAKYLAVPLVLVGFVLMLAFGIHSQLIDSRLLTQVSVEESGAIIRLILGYGFQLGLCVTVLGFGLAAWSKHLDKKVQAIDASKLAKELLTPLQGQLETKDEQIKALTEAITALSKTGAPAKSINDALQALERGQIKQAQAIFAEVLRSKEAEGKQANKEAAAAARHLGALAYMNDTESALAAYRKAVELDPDNAEGWNVLGALLSRTGELAQAKEAYRKVLALAEVHQDKEKQAWAYGNLGNVYYTRGDLDKAKEMYRKALEINEALVNKEGMARNYGNMGLVYHTRGDQDKAEEMHRKTLELYVALGNREGRQRYTAIWAVCMGHAGNWTRPRKCTEKHLRSTKPWAAGKALQRITVGWAL
jgi:tetratricopeptide (TPR) repeat protein